MRTGRGAFLPLLPLAALVALGGGKGAAMSRVQLVTHKWCPFAQRAWIALEAKGAEYEMREVSLYGAGGKPPWFLELNPKGQVPVLVVGGEPVVESDVCVDSVDSLLEPVGSLSPGGADGEARVTALRAIIDREVAPAGKELMLGGGSRAEQRLAEALASVDTLLQDGEGPFLCGEDLCRGDISAFPFLQRIDDEFGLASAAAPSGEECGRLCSWMAAMRDHPAVAATVMRNYWWWW